MKNDVIDELLEAIWTCREKQEPMIASVLRSSHGEANSCFLEQMIDLDLIRVCAENISLTPQGELAASAIIRRHRLAERLLADVLGMSDEEIEKAACSFEHSVMPEVTEGICTLLGHPHECPHGRPIPQGNCCLEGRTEAKSALMPLSESPCNQVARIAYIRPSHHERLHLLLSMGISPGAELRIHQRSPVLVVTIDQNEFALDREVADDIYVWPNSGS